MKAAKGTFKPSTCLVDKSRIAVHVEPLLGTRAMANLLAGIPEPMGEVVEFYSGSVLQANAGQFGPK